jgi:hypothetical protein
MAMTVLWLDPLSILLLCVNLVELVQICSVLMSWILSASTYGFFVLCCIIKLILGHVNFLTIQKPDRINMARPSDALKPDRFSGGQNFKRWQTRLNSGSCR